LLLFFLPYVTGYLLILMGEMVGLALLGNPGIHLSGGGTEVFVKSPTLSSSRNDFFAAISTNLKSVSYLV